MKLENNYFNFKLSFQRSNFIPIYFKCLGRSPSFRIKFLMMNLMENFSKLYIFVKTQPQTSHFLKKVAYCQPCDYFYCCHLTHESCHY